MTIEAKVYALIGNGSPIAELGDRVYPITAPSDVVKPYAIVTIVSQPPNSTHDEPLSALREWHFQVQFFSYDYDEARSISDSAKSLMVGQYGDGLGHILLEPPGVIPYYENDTKLYSFCVFFQAMESFT